MSVLVGKATRQSLGSEKIVPCFEEKYLGGGGDSVLPRAPPPSTLPSLRGAGLSRLCTAECGDMVWLSPDSLHQDTHHELSVEKMVPLSLGRKGAGRGGGTHCSHTWDSRSIAVK